MSTIARLSIEEYDRLIDSGVFDPPNQRRIELIQGELREKSPLGPIHGSLVDQLAEWSIRSLPEENVWVRVQNSLELPELDSVPQPDIGWVRRRDYSLHRPLADDVLLIIEVADSSLRYDYGAKADLYASAGITDYWVVDVPQRAVKVHRDPQEGRFQNVQTFSGEAIVTPLAFPQAQLKVATLFPAYQ